MRCSWWSTVSFSLELFVQVFFKLIDLMSRGADWSLADVQFVRDGMACGANLSPLARSCGWFYSSLKKLARRDKLGESGVQDGPSREAPCLCPDHGGTLALRHWEDEGSTEGTTFAIGQDRLLGRKDVQIRRERAQRTELQSAYESLTKARLETKHGRSRR